MGSKAKKNKTPFMGLAIAVLLLLIGVYCFYDAAKLRDCTSDNTRTNTIQLLNYGETDAESRFQSWWGWITDENNVSYAMRKEAYSVCREQDVFHPGAVLEISIDEQTTMRNPEDTGKDIPFIVSVKSDGKEWVSLQDENRIRHREKAIAIVLGVIFSALGFLGILFMTPLVYALALLLDRILGRNRAGNTIRRKSEK